MKDLENGSPQIPALMYITKDFLLNPSNANEDSYNLNFNLDEFKNTLQTFVDQNPYILSNVTLLYLAFKDFTSYRLDFQKSNAKIIEDLLNTTNDCINKALKNPSYKIQNLQLKIAKIGFNDSQNAVFPLDIVFSKDKKVIYYLDSEDLKYFLLQYINKNNYLKDTSKILTNTVEEITGLKLITKTNQKSMHQYFKYVQNATIFSKKLQSYSEISVIIDDYVCIIDRYNNVKKIKMLTDEDFLSTLQEVLDSEKLNLNHVCIIVGKVLEKYTGLPEYSIYYGNFSKYQKKAQEFLKEYKKNHKRNSVYDKAVGIYNGKIYIRYTSYNNDITYEELPITLDDLKKQIDAIIENSCLDDKYTSPKVIRVALTRITGIKKTFQNDKSDDTYIYLKQYISDSFSKKKKVPSSKQKKYLKTY